MSTLTFEASESSIATDDFAALEQAILRAAELLKAERAARAAAETKVAEIQASFEAQTSELVRSEAELEALKGERGLVKSRIERLLGQLDELSV